MADKEIKAYPETGWEVCLLPIFSIPTVVVDNRAKNGRSTKSFIAEGRWEAVKGEMRPGDYVFIQFGHNDEVATKATYTPQDQFEANLVLFVGESRQRHAIPVLITPVARRKFDSTGTVEETHAVYAAIVRKVAAAQHVPLVDLDAQSQVLLQQMGAENSKLLFDYLMPGENPHYPEGRMDDTHFNELGARRMAEMVLEDIRSLKLELAEHIFSPAAPAQPPAPQIDPGPFADNSGHWYGIFDKEDIIHPLPGHPRFAPTDLRGVADNILLFQKTNGGWPKNYDVFAILTPGQKDSVAAAAKETNTTFDNGSTYNQVAALATAWLALKDSRYASAASRGRQRQHL